MKPVNIAPPNDRAKIYPSKRDMAWSIMDEYSGQYWYDPGQITPRVYPSYDCALEALRNINIEIMADRTQHHKPQPIIVPWIGERETIDADVTPGIQQLKEYKRELSETQKSCGARVIA